MATHEVVNQAHPLEEYEMYDADTALREAVEREGAKWAHTECGEFGRLTGGTDLLRHGRLANENRPQPKIFDAYGHRVNVVEFHPSYHHLMRTSIAHGLHSAPWVGERSGRMVGRAAKLYLMNQVEAGHGCPVTMTFAVVPALAHEPSLAQIWTPRITSTAYDPSNRPASQKTGCMAGMAMTEKQGGSDVRANSTKAIPQSDGSFRLVGHKWFCSAPMSDVFLTLANDDEGLSCFLVPRWTPDDKPNAMNIQRLKDKLGDRSNASSEIEYDHAWATRVGAPGKGVRTIIDMVAHTRLDCVIASAALIRQVTSQALHHAEYRSTFGRRLIEHSAMQNVLADLALEAEASVALAMRLARAFDEGRDDSSQAAFARIATAIGKYWVCKRAPAAACEAMEALGGNGYTEAHPMARHYRQAPLNSIWEGSGNVICLDVLRAMVREPEALAALKSELAMSRGCAPGYDRCLNAIEAELDPNTNLEASARRLVERFALVLQAHLLVQGGNTNVAELFIESRLSGDRFSQFGTLPGHTHFEDLLNRAHPHRVL